MDLDKQRISNIKPIENFGEPLPKIDFSAMDKKREKDEEKIENFKRIAIATESINSKFDLLLKDIDFIINSLGANFQKLEHLSIKEKLVLEEILSVLKDKGNNESKTKIKALLADKGTDFILLIISLLIQSQMKQP